MTQSSEFDTGRGWYALPNWKTLRAFGPDAATWLNGVVTCDVLRVKDGCAAWGLLLNKQGKISAELQIVGHGQELWIGVSGGNVEEVVEVLDGYLIMEDAEIEIVERRWLVCGGDSSDSPQQKIPWGSLPWIDETIQAYCVTTEALADLESRLEGVCLDEQQWSAWLIHAGLPQWGQDFSSADNPHSASLERRAVDWSKGCYLGQEVVCMQDMRGKVRKRLVRLLFENPTGVNMGEEVFDSQGTLVGGITSISKACAIASIRAPAFEPETEVFVKNQKAVVSPLR